MLVNVFLTFHKLMCIIFVIPRLLNMKYPREISARIQLTTDTDTLQHCLSNNWVQVTRMVNFAVFRQISLYSVFHFAVRY